MNTQLNRAVAAMQFAKQQKESQEKNPVPTTKLFDAQNLPTKDANGTNNPVTNNPVTKTADMMPNSRANNPTVNTADSNHNPTPNALKSALKSTPKFTRVDISIAGTSHRINCPTDEVENVNHIADRLNNNLKDIRRNVSGKSPTNEELLILHCLELYDEIAELKKFRQNELIHKERVSALLDKILKDARTIL